MKKLQSSLTDILSIAGFVYTGWTLTSATVILSGLMDHPDHKNDAAILKEANYELSRFNNGSRSYRLLNLGTATVFYLYIEYHKK